MMIGRPLGQPTAEQFEQLAAKNVAVIQHQTARSKISPAKLLQNALRAMGEAMGDGKLSSLTVDGKIGPKTVAATNYAFANYLNAPNKMSQAYVQQHVNYLQQQVTQYVEAHGGTVNLPIPKVKNLPALTWPTPPSPLAPPPGGGGLFDKLPFDKKYLFYGVGGFSLLLLLAAVAQGFRRREPARRRKRDPDDE